MAEVILTTSILIIAILVFRQIARDRVSPTLIYALWLLAAVRILIPLPFSQYMPKQEKKVITVVETKWQLNESILSAKKDGEAHYSEEDAKLSEILPGEGKKPSEAIGDFVEKSEALVDKPASPLAENGALVDKSGRRYVESGQAVSDIRHYMACRCDDRDGHACCKKWELCSKAQEKQVYFRNG